MNLFPDSMSRLIVFQAKKAEDLNTRSTCSILITFLDLSSLLALNWLILQKAIMMLTSLYL